MARRLARKPGTIGLNMGFQLSSLNPKAALANARAVVQKAVAKVAEKAKTLAKSVEKTVTFAKQVVNEKVIPSAQKVASATAAKTTKVTQAVQAKTKQQVSNAVAAAKQLASATKKVADDKVWCPLKKAWVNTNKIEVAIKVVKNLVPELLERAYKKFGEGALRKVIEKGAKNVLKPGNVKIAAKLVKAAGNSLKPAAKKLAPSLVKQLGKTTNKKTVDAIAKSLKALAPKAAGKIAGAVGSLVNPIVEAADRLIEGKPLTSKEALFDYGASIVKGVVTTALVGLVVANPVSLAGLAVAVGVSVIVDYASEPGEDFLKKELRIVKD